MSIKRYSPDELLKRYLLIRKVVRPREFFNSPEHKKTQEMWCAAHFGRHYEHGIGPCHILIADNDLQTDTDFELEVDGGKHPFQVTEVQTPGRRRGDEYKIEASSEMTLESWDEGTEQGAQWIRDSIEKKFRRYGGHVSRLNLLVYLNFPAYDQEYMDIQMTCAEVALPFASVWLLSGNATACIWSQTSLNGPSNWIFGSESLAREEP